MNFRRRKLVLAKLINVLCSIFSTALGGKLLDKCDLVSYQKHIYKAVVGNCIPLTLSWNKIKGSYIKCRKSSLENKANELNILSFIYKHHTFLSSAKVCLKNR